MSERETVTPTGGGGSISRRDALRITAVGGLGLAFGGALARAALERAGLERVRETRARLGTLVTLTAVHPDAEAARRIVRAGFREIERLEGLLSRHASGTPLVVLNREGRLDEAPDELLTVLARAREVFDKSGGAFDPTVAPLLALYERARANGAGVPDEATVRRVQASVGLDAVEVSGHRVRFARPGMGLTLDGIAKGFVVDRAVGAVTDAGAERVMVDAGGDIASGGPAARDEPWTVAIQDPHDAERALGTVRLNGGAVATSGDYMQAFTQDRRHHHILDPRTGRSPIHTSAVTVRASTAMDADALSTAILVLGPEDGVRMIERFPGAEALVVGKDGRRTVSSGFTA